MANHQEKQLVWIHSIQRYSAVSNPVRFSIIFLRPCYIWIAVLIHGFKGNIQFPFKPCAHTMIKLSVREYFLILQWLKHRALKELASIVQSLLSRIECQKKKHHIIHRIYFSNLHQFGRSISIHKYIWELHLPSFSAQMSHLWNMFHLNSVFSGSCNPRLTAF